MLWIIPLTLVCLLVIALSLAMVKYQRIMAAERARIRAGCLNAETPHGPIEYGSVGDGPPVLILHGGGGGYDQGLLVGHAVQRQGFRIIAPSRPGYLGTPLTTGRLPAEQADASAALLDSLGIGRVAVIGVSAGGPTALQFALHHADRCSALIMLSAISRAHALNWLMALSSRWVAGSGFLVWLPAALAERQILSGMGPTNREVFQNPEKVEALRTLLMQGARGKLIWDGLLNDLIQNENLPDLPLHSISLPTLVIHGIGDAMVNYKVGEYTAASIPGARFEAVEQAGHLCFITHEEQVIPRIVDFLQKCASIS